LIFPQAPCPNPASSLSQVISFTLVAARVAGTFCGFWLIALGIIGKFGAFLANAPNVILGGLQTFVFATVAMAGIRVSHSARLCLTPLHTARKCIALGACSRGAIWKMKIVYSNHKWPLG
jgi:xanthine/uracil permease